MDVLMRSRWLVLGAAVAVTLAACSKDVDAPAFDNPFDPDSPTAGEAYSLNAVTSGDAIQLQWANVLGLDGFPAADSSLGVGQYIVLHGTGGAAPTDQLGRNDVKFVIAPVAGQALLAEHLTYVPETVNSYKIRSISQLDYVDSKVVQVDAPLEFRTVVGTNVAAALDVDFLVRTGVSEMVDVALDADFTVALDSVEVTPGTLTRFTYTIAPFTGPSGVVEVFYRGRTASSTGAVASIELSPGFTPRIEPASGIWAASATQFFAVDDTVSFVANGEGVESLTVFVVDDTLRVDLFTVGDPALPFVLPLDDERAFVRNTADEQTGWSFGVAAASELGFETERTITFSLPDSVSGASITVDEASEVGIVTTREVTVSLAAEDVGEFRLSENADFSGSVWRDFVESTPFTLSAGAGEKTLYAAFRNDFTTPVAVTLVRVAYVPPPLAASGSPR